MSATAANSMAILDDDSLFLILNWLAIEEKIALQRVSRQWNRIITEQLREQNSLTFRINKTLDDLIPDDVVYRCLTGNVLCGVFVVNRGALIKLSQKCPNVRRIDVAYYPLKLRNFELIVDAWPNVDTWKFKVSVQNKEFWSINYSSSSSSGSLRNGRQ